MEERCKEVAALKEAITDAHHEMSMTVNALEGLQTAREEECAEEVAERKRVAEEGAEAAAAATKEVRVAAFNLAT